MASQIMLKDFLFLKGDMPLNEMVDIMLEHKVNELPVLDDNDKIIGDVNFLEFIKFLSENKYLINKESEE